MVDAIQRQLKAVRDAKLVIHLSQIILNHLLSRTNLAGDFLVSHALRDAGDDEQLFIRELRFGTRRGKLRGLRAVGFNYPIDALIVDPGFPPSHLAHTLDDHFRAHASRPKSTNTAPEIFP